MKRCIILYEIRRWLQKTACQMTSAKFMSEVYYRILLREKLNLKDPKTFNEKLSWLKLYYFADNQLVVKCADKYTVREYVYQKGGDEYLNELIGVWDNVDEIDWEALPERFVIKCNHGCGYNILCDDKSKLNIDTSKKKLSKWMKQDFGLYNSEPHYSKISRKIICEKYIETTSGILPNDYKIYCFNGEPKLVLVCTERLKDLRLSWFNLDWNVMEIGIREADRTIKKPTWFDNSIEILRKLANDFPFVRIDVYDGGIKAIFGEMTFTPAAGIARYYSKEGNMLLGGMLNIDELLGNKEVKNG